MTEVVLYEAEGLAMRNRAKPVVPKPTRGEGEAVWLGDKLEDGVLLDEAVEDAVRDAEDVTEGV